MLMAQPPLLLCFQISQLLSFYQRTVSSMLGPRCQLADTLAATCKLARRVFAEQLKARGDKLLRYPPKPQPDLSPPPQVATSAPLIPLACRVDAKLHLQACVKSAKHVDCM